MASKKKNCPVWVMVVCDILALAAGLLLFAYFHHARPSKLTPDRDVSIPVSTAAGGADSTDFTATTTADSVKFADKFTSDGSVEITETLYRSGNVHVSLNKVFENDITYYVADIYLKNITSFKTALAGGEYAKGATETVDVLAAENSAIIAVNGDYYGISSTRGTVIRNGTYYRGNVWGDTGVLFADGELKTYSSSEMDVDAVLAASPWQAWSFGPSLLDGNGNSKTEFDTNVAPKNPRTAIGFFEPGHYCIVVVDGRQEGYSVGMSMTELSELFASLGCKSAYNLDGGQSSVMYFNGRIVNRPYKGGRASSDIVYIGE